MLGNLMPPRKEVMLVEEYGILSYSGSHFIFNKRPPLKPKVGTKKPSIS